MHTGHTGLQPLYRRIDASDRLLLRGCAGHWWTTASNRDRVLLHGARILHDGDCPVLDSSVSS